MSKSSKSRSSDEERVLQLIDKENYEELFTRGYCFHFALCSFNLGIGTLHQIKQKYDECIHHVFVITPHQQVFDCRGFRSIHSLSIDLQYPLEPEVISQKAIEEKIQELIDKREISPTTNALIFDTAERMISKILILTGRDQQALPPILQAGFSRTTLVQPGGRPTFNPPPNHDKRPVP